jgi:hypothetical protein
MSNNNVYQAMSTKLTIMSTKQCLPSLHQWLLCSNVYQAYSNVYQANTNDYFATILPISTARHARPIVDPTKCLLLGVGVAPAGFRAGSGLSIPFPFNLVGLIFYQTHDPIGFGAPTGTRLAPYVLRVIA